MKTTPAREHILFRIRMERNRQLERYGDNVDLPLGFGSSLSAYPWLHPYSEAGAFSVEKAFRHDYEVYESFHGKPTWMHLIREEVAELFSAEREEDIIAEAIQVAALCVSLVETHTKTGGFRA